MRKWFCKTVVVILHTFKTGRNPMENRRALLLGERTVLYLYCNTEITKDSVNFYWSKKNILFILFNRTDSDFTSHGLTTDNFFDCFLGEILYFYCNIDITNNSVNFNWSEKEKEICKFCSNIFTGPTKCFTSLGLRTGAFHTDIYETHCQTVIYLLLYVSACYPSSVENLFVISLLETFHATNVVKINHKF